SQPNRAQRRRSRKIPMVCHIWYRCSFQQERRRSMRHVFSWFVAFLAVATLASLTTSRAFAGDSGDKTAPSPPKAHEEQAKATLAPGTTEQEPPEVNLLEAMRQGAVSVQAEGLGDGRMKMSLTNRTSRPLRVVLPPGVVAQGATGQF